MAGNIKWSSVRFQRGSYITVEGTPTNGNFYLIRDGSVSTKQESVIDLGSTLGPGDFINVVSVLSGHDCEESALALTDVTLIVIKRHELPDLIRGNAPIALKILRLFSKKLRMYDHYVEQLSGVHHPVNIGFENIYVTGQYYLRQNQKELARYAFTRYLQINPSGPSVSDIKIYLDSMGGVDKFAGANNASQAFIRNDSRFIFCESEPGQEFYFIKSGHIKITKVAGDKETMFAVLNPGDLFGEMAVLEDKQRNANAITQGETELMVINKATFSEFINNQIDLVVKLIQTLADRIWVSSRRISHITMKEPVGKMYDTLVTLIEKEHLEFTSKKTYKFGFGFLDLARMAGIPQERVGEAIEKINHEKVLTLDEGNKIFVADLKKLKSSAAYYKTFDTIEKKRVAKK